MEVGDDFLDDIAKKNAALWKKKSFASGLKRTWVAEKDGIEKLNTVSVKPPKQVCIINKKGTYKYSLKMSEETNKNISGLRDHLFSAIEKLEGGTMKADEAKAMASLAQTIINSAKLELDYKSMVEKNPDIKMLNG